MPNQDESFEITVEDEMGNEVPTEEEDRDKLDNVSVGKQSKLPSASNDDADRMSHNSSKPPIESGTPAASGSRKERPSTANSEGAPVAAPPVVVQPVFPPPWPEWSDDFINEETWDVDSGIDYFEDVFAATDFLNMKAYDWLRPTEFLREPPYVVRFSAPIIDLITPNAHLCEKSEVLRYILGEISELYDYSIQNKFVECEGEGVAYVPNYAEDDRRWTPWNHIYSCCKAGVRGEKPVYNSKGKYYVRLYFLGAWRRILVDDRIPVLPSGHSGLPLTSLNELWPLLLTKALLKVAIVTWKDDDVRKFSAISALTGWVFEWIDNIDGVSENDLWADLENTLPKYTDPKRIPSCYTLLKPSRKKRRFGDVEEPDTFWWMPPVALHPTDLEEIASKEDAEDEPFEVDINDIITNVPISTIETNELGEQIMKPALEVKWKRKTVIAPRPDNRKSRKLHQESVLGITASSRNILDANGHLPGDTGDETAETGEPGDDKNEFVHAADGMTAPKKKKKKAGIGAALEDSKSEKKSLALKKHRKQKDGLDVGKARSELKKRSRLVSTNDVQEQDTTDAAEEEEEEKVPQGKKSVKLKGLKNWAKLKNILMGDSEVQLPPRGSRSLRKSFIARQDLAPSKSKQRRKRGERQEEDGSSLVPAEDAVEETKLKRPSLPSVPEILYGVQKYAGIDYRNIVKNWENICGKDSPISLMVVLKEFPMPEEENLDSTMPFVPAFLQHPIQLTEVRDTVLQKQTDRPTTPLWKRFRWKKWAMKKGLIPMEEDRSKDIIRAVKAKTPFVFKSDWYDFNVSNKEEYEEDEEEYEGEDDDDDFYGGGSNAVNTFFFSLKGAKSKEKEMTQEQEPPPTPPPTKAISPPKAQRRSKRNSDIAPSVLGATLHLHPHGRASVTESVRPQEQLVVPHGPDPKPHASRKSVKSARSAAVSAVPESPPHDSDKVSSLLHVDNGGKLEPTSSNMTVILHEAELVGGESEEDFDEGFKRKMLKSQDNIPATAACASLWFNCADIARNLRKFCKFYTSQSIFGSCYILRREPSISPMLSPLFYELHSNLPKYPDMLTEYKHRHDCLNTAIAFDRYKSYHVTDYHLDDREGIDSAFYLFSDCWTEQELILTVHILQEDFLKQYNDATKAPLNEEMPGPPPTPMTRGVAFAPPRPRTPKYEDLQLTLVIEPWDWRQDTCLTRPLLVCTWIKDRWISHVNLPAGRNTFRIWLFYQEQSGNSGGESKSSRRTTPDSGDEALGQNEFLRKKNTVPFSLRIVSQTPIYVGSRSEVLNYMTNSPMIFLKQADRLANNLWGLFACFGKQRSVYVQNLRQLRRSYCPAYSHPNKINKLVRGAHDTFEELLVSLVTLYNDGKLDRMLILALRVLFLNPTIGRHLARHLNERKSYDVRVFYGIFRGIGKKARWMLNNATLIIQRYYRGWRVRRLFQLRKPSHPDFKRIEYHVRRLAYLLAKETDSLFAQKDPVTGEYGSNFKGDDVISVADFSVDPEKVPPTILPTPPHWAVDMLRYLTERHPWLSTIHPYANCVPHHIKIQEIEGELPQRVKFFSWYPFFREVLKVPPEAKSCFVELDLQVYPVLGVHLKIVNNDNGKFLRTVNNRLFIGRLFENKHGYTVLCFRWATPTFNQELNDRPSSNMWKLRLVTPHDQDGPRFQSRIEFLAQVYSGEDINANSIDNMDAGSKKSLDGGVRKSVGGVGEKRESMFSSSSEAEEFPSKLSLRRMTGYYTPNKDYSVCQYILETEEKRATVSLRFLASNSQARLRVLIWDCNKKVVVFDEVCKGGLIAPCVQLHLPQRAKKKEDSSEEPPSSPPWDASMESLHSPVSEELEGSNSGILEVVMSSTNNARKGSSKISLGEEEEDAEEENQTNSPEEEAKSETGGRKDSVKSNAMSTTSDPPEEKKPILTNKRRFIISVYVMDDTWPLTDRELLYVLYRERKFFRSIKSHHCKQVAKQKEETKRKAEEAEQQEAVAAAAALAMVDAQSRASQAVNKSLGGAAGIEFKLTAAPGEGAPVTPPGAEQTLDVKKDYKDMQSVKRRTKRKDGGGGTTAENSTPPPTTQQGDSSVSPYPTTPPPTTISVSDVGFGDDIKKAGQKLASSLKKLNEKIKRRMNGNLHVKYGGHQCQNVKHLDQPHWIMELVTESKVKYKLKSNWQILKKRLLQAQESWESGGVELLYQDLSTRLDYLLENMVEENYNKVKQHKFSMVDPMVNLFSCLHMDEYNLKGVANHELVRLLLQAWSVDPDESKKAGERFLQIRVKTEPVTSKTQEDEPQKPEQFLNYVPKNLRQMAETFLKRIEERELERERQLNKSELLDEENEEEEEEEEDEPESVLVSRGSTARSELRTKEVDGDGLTMRNSRLGIPGASSSPKKVSSDARTERSVMRKAKKPATGAKSQGDIALSVKPGAKKGKNERERSMSLKGKEGRDSDQQGTAKNIRNSRAESENRRKSTSMAENKEEEPKVDPETELLRIRSCAHVGTILKKYDYFFKEPMSIREALVELIEGERHRQVEDGPKKLLLTKTGISKYAAEKSDAEESEHEEEEDLENRESMTVARLLRWAYDYSFLPPTDELESVIEDPGELPLFFMRTIMEEQRIREQLEQELADAAAARAAAEMEGEEE